MALTVVFNGTNLTTAENTTGWAKTGTISNPVQETDLVIQGTYAVSTKASAKSGALYYDVQNTLGAGVNLDFSPGGTYDGQCLYFWMNCTTLGAITGIATGGLRIWLATDTSNYAEWYVFGSDTLDRYSGGWIRLVLDPRTEATSMTGTFNRAAVRYVGMYINATGSSKSENLILDRIDVGYGLRVYGTDTDGWNDVLSADMGTNTNKYGIFQEKDGVFYVYGRIAIGDNVGTNATSFSSESRIIKWVDQQYYGSTLWKPSVMPDFYRLDVVGNATNTTIYQDGVQVGSGDAARGRSSSTFIGSIHDVTMSLYDGSNSGNRVYLYGTKFKKITGGITWGNDSNHVFYGGVVDQCGLFDPVGAVKIRNVTFSKTADTRRSLVQAISYNGSTLGYTDQTAAANNNTINDMTLITGPTINDAFFFCSKTKFNELWIRVTTTGVGNTVSWSYSTATGVSTLTTTNNFVWSYSAGTSNAQFRYLNFTPPADWVPRAVTSGYPTPYYYIVARVTVAGATAALGGKAYLFGPPGGDALKWNANIDIKNCRFLANTDTTNDPHAILHEDPGEFTYDGLIFGSNDYDIENAIDILYNEDSYLSYDTWQTMTTQSQYLWGQSLTTSYGGRITQCEFILRRWGAPTGTLRAYLYAHSGTYGTSSVPTGAPLATSTTIGDIANVGTASTGSPFYFDFDENDTYDMANATNYVIVLEVNYTSYDGSNYIGIGEDRSTPTHGGNRSSSLNGGSSWSPDSAADLRFSVTSNGMRVTGINRSNPSTFEETGLSQLTLIYIPVTLEVTTENQVGNAIEGVRVRIEETNGTLIAEGSTDSSGVFQYTTYDYDVTGGDVDVNIIARLRGYKYVSTTSTITIDGMTVPFTLLRDEAVFLP